MNFDLSLVVLIIAAVSYFLLRWTLSATKANLTPSRTIFWLSFVATTVCALASAFWFDVFRSSEGMAVGVFLIVAVVLGGSTVIICLAPSAVLYFRHRRTWDFVSLALSVVTVAVLGLEAFLLVHLRGF